MRESRVELERNAPLCREVRDFQAKVQACGPPYQQWCAELRAEFPALVSTGGSLASATPPSVFASHDSSPIRVDFDARRVSCRQRTPTTRTRRTRRAPTASTAM